MTVRIRSGLREAVVQTIRADYDFAKQGGAISSIGLTGRLLIPTGYTIIGGWVEIVTALTSSGAATAALHVEGAGDIVPAQVLGTWSIGRKAIVPAMDTSAVLAAAKNVRTTARRDVTLDIAAFALTAGKFSVLLHVLQPLK